MIYLDTSVLGAMFFREPNAGLVFGQVKAARSHGLVILGLDVDGDGECGGHQRAHGRDRSRNPAAGAIDVPPLRFGQFDPRRDRANRFQVGGGTD